MRTPTLQRDELVAGAFVAILTGAPVISLSAASGGFFPPAWSTATIGFALAAAAVLAASEAVEFRRLDAVGLGALVGLAAWIALSLTWTQSTTRTALELQRALAYVAAFATLLLAVRRTSWRAGLAGVSAAVGALALYGLATRLFPDVFGFDTEAPYQLSRPIGYWNALGLVAAMSVVLALGWAAHAERRSVRLVSAGLLPALVAAQYFTFSRGAWVALVLALGLLFVSDTRRARPAAVLLAVLPFAAGAVALAARSDGLTSTDAGVAAATRDGHRLALALIVLCAAAAAAASATDRIGSQIFRRPHLRPAVSYAAMTLGVAAAVVLLLWGGGPRAIADRAYDAFVGPPVLGDDDLNARLLSASGNSRADYWSVALQTVEDAPLVGTGAGTFELRWYLLRPGHGTVRDAHNLYLEVLAELGPIGLLLLVTALGAPLAALRASRDPLAAAGGAAYAAYLAHAGLDWDWELPAVTIPAFGAAASLMASARPGGIPLRRQVRAAAIALTVVVATAGAAGYLGARAIDASASAFDAGAYAEARDEADEATRFAPWSADALIARGEAELALGERDAARRSFRSAAAKEPNDWFAWYELALAAGGPERERAIERALELNPLSPEVAALAR